MNCNGDDESLRSPLLLADSASDDGEPSASNGSPPGGSASHRRELSIESDADEGDVTDPTGGEGPPRTRGRPMPLAQRVLLGQTGNDDFVRNSFVSTSLRQPSVLWGGREDLESGGGVAASIGSVRVQGLDDAWRPGRRVVPSLARARYQDGRELSPHGSADMLTLHMRQREHNLQRARSRSVVEGGVDDTQLSGQHALPPYALPPELFGARGRVSHTSPPLSPRRSLETDRSPNRVTSVASLASLGESNVSLDKEERMLIDKMSGVGAHSALEEDEEPPRGDFATIFSMWNSMVGGGVLVLPYGFMESGLVMGIIMSVFIGGVCLYTALLVARNGSQFDDLSDMAGHHLGRWAQLVSIVVMVIMLFGAVITYDLMLVDCLAPPTLWPPTGDPQTGPPYDAPVVDLAPPPPSSMPHVSSKCGRDSFNCYSPATATLAVALFLLPLACFRTLGAIVRLNSVGPFFLVYLLFFIVTQSVTGHYDEGGEPVKPLAHLYWDRGFMRLGGLLVCSFFIHHAIIPILKSNRGSPNNERNLIIAFSLAVVCYVVPGIVGNYSFDYIQKTKTHGVLASMNFLNSFSPFDPFPFSARCAVALQLTTVLPLLLYIIRTQLFGILFGTPYPSFVHVLVLNVSVLLASSLCSYYQVGIGSVMRYSGSGCGLVLIFCVPVVVNCIVLRRRGKLTPSSLAAHVGMVLFGLLLLISQFIPVTDDISAAPITP